MKKILVALLLCLPSTIHCMSLVFGRSNQRVVLKEGVMEVASVSLVCRRSLIAAKVFHISKNFYVLKDNTITLINPNDVDLPIRNAEPVEIQKILEDGYVKLSMPTRGRYLLAAYGRLIDKK